MKFLLAIFMIMVQPSVQSEHLSVTFEGKEITSLHRSELAIPSFEGEFIDQEKLDELTASLESVVYEPPSNAYLDEHGQIKSEEMGHKLDQEKWKANVYVTYLQKGSNSIEVPVKTIYPKVDSELLTSIKAKLISHYVTYFNSRNMERSHNIKLASEAINNHVIFPGETFSFNAVVGKRTIEKGYLPAPVIVRGELSEGIGGGICQVSSTLFNAVDRAGVKIIERYSHSRRVPYVPSKRDATVSWYGPDFTFENEHNQPLLIQSKVYGGQLIIKIFSSETLEIKQQNIQSAPNQLPEEERL
ncbi:VanW family protein [Metabacillus sp. YM-086]|uniref:VanW family protein n=1 Tax=Metabacillus sp. YM-086 TaxID=3341729 RepID=UPI003A851035